MSELRAINLGQIINGINRGPTPVRILWQEEESLAFVARGRKHRSEFHIDPSDEVMYMLKGDMELHYVTAEGERKVAVIREGEIIHCPAGIPHSPRFSPDAFVLVLERKRRTGEQDRFLWFCEQCDSPLYETSRRVSDYHEDPVSRAHEEFYSVEARRTCSRCGHVTPRPNP
jgi:3-hydroxyanthranilate 3,4-dioxygenase